MTTRESIDAAFASLTASLSAIRDEINRTGAVSFGGGDYRSTRAELGVARKVTRALERLARAQAEWEGAALVLAGAGASPAKAAARAAGGGSRAARARARARSSPRRRLRPGVRTPQQVFYLPILRALVEMGGAGRPKDVLARVEEMLREQLKPVDYEPLASAPSRHRWEASACWARTDLVKSGLLRRDAPRRLWQISRIGREHARQPDAGD